MQWLSQKERGPAFIPSLSLIILLITPQTRVLMTLGFAYTEEDLIQLSNALVLLVTLITIAGEYKQCKIQVRIIRL